MPIDRRRRPSARLLSALTLTLSLVAASGCEHDEPPNTSRKVVEVKDVPENVMRAFKKALPNVTAQDAWQNLDTKTKALHSYEVRGRDKRGKIREVRVSPEGEVLEME